MKYIIREGLRYWYRDDCKFKKVCKVTMPGEGNIVESCDHFRKSNDTCKIFDGEMKSDKQKCDENN